MPLIVDALGTILTVVRGGFLAGSLVVFGVCGVDWLVRTRRLNPFGAVARLVRRTIDPVLRPIERRVVRAGGLPTNAPWWALAAVVLSGIVLISLLEFLRSQLALVSLAVESGPAGIYRVVVTWSIAVLQLAVIVRVLLSWVPTRPGSWYARWAFRLTEPLFRPPEPREPRL